MRACEAPTYHGAIRAAGHAMVRDIRWPAGMPRDGDIVRVFRVESIRTDAEATNGNQERGTARTTRAAQEQHLCMCAVTTPIICWDGKRNETWSRRGYTW